MHRRRTFKSSRAARIAGWPTLRTLQQRYIQQALKESAYNVSAVARQLDVDLTTLHRWCRLWQLQTKPTGAELAQYAREKLEEKLAATRGGDQ